MSRFMSRLFRRQQEKEQKSEHKDDDQSNEETPKGVEVTTIDDYQISSGEETKRQVLVERELVSTRKKIEPAEKEFRRATEVVEREIEQALFEKKYEYPKLTLLNAESGSKQKKDELGCEAEIQKTFQSHGIEAQFVEKAAGSRFTRYEFKLPIGTKLITAKHAAKDIAFALGKTEIQIDMVLGKPSTISVDVPNNEPLVVPLRVILESDAYAQVKKPDVFPIGTGISGEGIFCNLSEIRNLLLVGTTGAGKTSFLHSMIISLLYHASPEEIRFLMIAPQAVELTSYNGIPHLFVPVITDPNKAIAALQWVEFEISRRYKTIQGKGVRNLSGYNTLVERENGLKKIPALVVIVDRLDDVPDLMSAVGKDTLYSLANRGAIVGVHLIVACTKARRSIVESFSNRIAFSVSTVSQSCMVIGREGAESLEGNGQLFYLFAGMKKPVWAQAAHVSAEEIARVAEHVKSAGYAYYDLDIMQQIELATRVDTSFSSAPTEEMNENDELLPAAMDLVFEIGQVSTSMLQRKLKLSYSRASHLVDLMEVKGYVGPFNGSQPRELLITKQQWQDIKKTLK